MALITRSVMNPNTWAVPAGTAASASDTFQMPSGDGQAFAYYTNTSASTRLITVVIPAAFLDPFGRAVTNVANTIAATTGVFMVPLQPEMADLTTGLITITTAGAIAGFNVAHVVVA